MWKKMKQVNEIVSYLVSVDAKRMISGSIVHTCDLYTPAKPKELSQRDEDGITNLEHICKEIEEDIGWNIGNRSGEPCHDALEYS